VAALVNRGVRNGRPFVVPKLELEQRIAAAVVSRLNRRQRRGRAERDMHEIRQTLALGCI